MGAAAPVEVGTRGTVASLVIKEIEYFRGLELGHHGSSEKPGGHVVETASRRSNSWPGFSSLVVAWRRNKKARSSSAGLLPSMCSVVEVANSHGMNEISGFNYRNLKDDVKKI